MNSFYVISLGGFIISAAHYIHDGLSVFYVAWCLGSIILAIAARMCERQALKA